MYEDNGKPLTRISFIERAATGNTQLGLGFNAGDKGRIVISNISAFADERLRPIKNLGSIRNTPEKQSSPQIVWGFNENRPMISKERMIPLGDGTYKMDIELWEVEGKPIKREDGSIGYYEPILDSDGQPKPTRKLDTDLSELNKAIEDVVLPQVMPKGQTSRDVYPLLLN